MRNHKLALLVVLLVIVALGADRRSRRSRKPSGVSAYDKYEEPLRSRLVEAYETKLAALEQSLKEQAKSARDRKLSRSKKADISKRAKATKVRIRELKKNDPIYIPKLSSSASYWEVGEFGTYDGDSLYMVRNLGDDRALVVRKGFKTKVFGRKPRSAFEAANRALQEAAASSPTVYIVVEGFKSTAAADQKIDIPDMMEVVGTDSYSTPDGRKELLVVRPVLFTEATTNKPDESADKKTRQTR